MAFCPPLMGFFTQKELKGEIFNLCGGLFISSKKSLNISVSFYYIILLPEYAVFSSYQFYRGFQKRKTIFP